MKLPFLFVSCAAVVLLFSQALAEDAKLPPTVADGAKLIEEYAADAFFEGPTWDPKTAKLYFTSFKGKSTQVLRLDKRGAASVWMDNTEGINGTFYSFDGQLLGAQARGHRIVKVKFSELSPVKYGTLLKDTSLNQPNDVCQTPSGDIYFSDPDFKNRKTSAVYHLAKSGKVTKIIDDMPLPNGVITSLDGQTLYVGDSHQALWRSYPIKEDGSVGAGKTFLNPDTKSKAAPDGMTIDERGNLYFTGRGGVWVAASNGTPLGFIAVPESISNATFGGEEGKALFLTCNKKVYSLNMKVRGGQFVRDTK
jgi:gluconolactonase